MCQILEEKKVDELGKHTEIYRELVVSNIAEYLLCPRYVQAEQNFYPIYFHWVRKTNELQE